MSNETHLSLAAPAQISNVNICNFEANVKIFQQRLLNVVRRAWWPLQAKIQIEFMLARIAGSLESLLNDGVIEMRRITRSVSI